MNDIARFEVRKDVRELDADFILARAVSESALAHHLDAGLEGRVRDIVGRVNLRGLVTTQNADAAERQFVGNLVTRLAFAESQAQHPEIAKETVRRPIVVVGYARTGSTIMHSLLAADPDGYAPQAWETFFPSPPPGISSETIPARVAAADRNILDLLARLPALTFHPYFDRLGHCIVECDEIFSVDFRNGIVDRYPLAPVAMLDTTMADPEGGYAFHASMLRQLQFKRDFGHWVVKGTRHQSYLRQLFDTYPDAICVYTHRDPNETVGSVLRSAELFIEGYEGSCDRKALAEYTPGQIAGIYDAIIDDPMMNDPRVIHVRFQDFMADHVATIRGIYEQAGLEFTDTYAKAIRDWLDDPSNKSDRYGKFKYALEEYGVDPKAVEQKFARYVERFDLARP